MVRIFLKEIIRMLEKLKRAYEDSKKVGDWVYYSPEGAIDSMISYDSGISKRPGTGINYVDTDGLKMAIGCFMEAISLPGVTPLMPN